MERKNIIASKDNNRNENIIGKITNRAQVINSSNFNRFNVERIKHTIYKKKSKGRGKIEKTRIMT